MLARSVILFAACAAASCDYQKLPQLSAGDARLGDGASDAPPFPVLSVEVSPSTFLLHVNDTRQTVVKVKNVGAVTSETPALAAQGLTLGTMTFSNSTCTGTLAAGASCTATGTLSATTAGDVQFQVVASATSAMTGMAMASVTVMAACPTNCGLNANANCCASTVVPGNAIGATLEGTAFFRSYDGTSAFSDQTAPATVGDFRLDTFEVTVGRFRAFVNAGMGTANTAPAAGAGAHDKISGSGWDASWNGNLVASTTALQTATKCNATYQTWTDTAGSNENLPINCINWYEAFAFCIWDGGYLPTEAEWNYAASGGSEQRAYPWSNPPTSTTVDCSYANYKSDIPSGTYCVNGSTGAANRVGSESPKGDGKFGQTDLAGNMFEWNLDWFTLTYSATCNDCASLTDSSSGNRVVRGGDFFDDSGFARTAERQSAPPAPLNNLINAGVRCARKP